MANIIFGKLIEDVKKRLDIRYYNNFNALDACLKTHVESMPKIISKDITQVISILENSFPSVLLLLLRPSSRF
jgi:RNAse (barnase) inhibitor barstar